jgi:AcrR family transcriptional regulator
MTDRRNVTISLRKSPKQARSSELIRAVLEGAVQVLVAEGASRFTMARVAERAGVSVGSLYQYFPNKAAILFRLQSDEWSQTSRMMQTILEDRGTPALERVRLLTHAFVRSECEEAAVRNALDDAAPLYRDAPEAKATKATAHATFQHFMEEALPGLSETHRAVVAHLLKTTLSEVGKHFSETPRSAPEIEVYADALADMFCSYLIALNLPRPPAAG